MAGKKPSFRRDPVFQIKFWAWFLSIPIAFFWIIEEVPKAIRRVLPSAGEGADGFLMLIVLIAICGAYLKGSSWLAFEVFDRMPKDRDGWNQ